MICPEVYLYRKCTVVFNDASLWKDIVGVLSSYLLIFGSATVHDIKNWKKTRGCQPLSGAMQDPAVDFFLSLLWLSGPFMHELSPCPMTTWVLVSFT